MEEGKKKLELMIEEQETKIIEIKKKIFQRKIERKIKIEEILLNFLYC